MKDRFIWIALGGIVISALVVTLFWCLVGAALIKYLSS